MAFEIVDAVFDLPLADPHAKLVLLALARHADRQGGAIRRPSDWLS